MAGAGPVSSVLGLLLVSALFGVLGERPSPDLGAHPEHLSQLGPGATEPRRRPPPKDQRERARAGALPLGALYTAAVVAFVLYKCLQVRSGHGLGESWASISWGRHSEQQLVQLTQQLAQTEQHLNNLMTQLDPLFERVTTLVGTQRELLSVKLKTVHRLLQDCKPDVGVQVPGKQSGGDSWETKPAELEQADLSLTEASIPFPEDLGKEDQQEAGNSQTCEGHINWSPDSWNLAPSWEVEQGLRRRWHKTVKKDPAVKGGQPLKGQ
ncbi:Coiled-coil domain-containing protein 107 [Lemmus lemmus]